MRRTRLFLLLLLLGALQGLGPLLHAHRDALAFVGGVHLPGMTTDVSAPGGAAAGSGRDAVRLEAHADSGAYVTAVSGIGDRERLDPVASTPASVRSPQPAPAREGKAARPPPADEHVVRPPHLRPAPQAPPRA